MIKRRVRFLWYRVNRFAAAHYRGVAQTISIGIVVVGLIIFVSALYQVYGRKGPVEILQRDPMSLGSFCPHTRYNISNYVRVKYPTISTYYVSVMNKTREFNIPGTQELYRGFTYPIEGTFFQSIPWTAPDLTPGTYARVFGAVGVNDNGKPQFIYSLFTIKPRKDCIHGSESTFPSSPAASH